jgi:predicted HD superfamily hydrolase involved in NAD metabolism
LKEKVGEMDQIFRELHKISDLLLSNKRFLHIKSCVDFAVQLAKIHEVDEDRVAVAGFAHDIFRDVKPDVLLRMAVAYRIRITKLERLNPILLHGKIAAEFVKRRFNLRDREILQAIAYHTSGKENLADIGKIVFLSDSLEENRIYDNINWLRQVAKQDLNQALFLIVENKIQYAIKRGLFILPETVRMWNWLIELQKGNSNWNWRGSAVDLNKSK